MNDDFFEAESAWSSYVPSSEVVALVEAQQALAFSLLAGQPPESGTFFSPYSVHQALAMLLVGARGETRAQLATLLGADAADDGWMVANAELRSRLAKAGNSEPMSLTIANGLFPLRSGTIDPAALGRAADMVAGAEVRSLDGLAPEAARQAINQWVSERTEGLVNDLIPPGGIAGQTALAMANAVYFHGEWRDQFPPEATQAGEFLCLDGTSVCAPFMHLDLDTDYCADDGWQVVAMDYDFSGLRAVCAVPDAGPPTLTADRWARLRGLLAEWQVQLALPRFGASADLRLNDALQPLGLRDLFRTGVADLTGFGASLRGVAVEEIWHKAVLSVDEQGTTAAAASAPAMELGGSGPLPTVALTIDRPFVFLIEDWYTGAILFLGRIANPGGEVITG